MTTCTPKYDEVRKVIAPFGITLDCDMWRDAPGTRQMAQLMAYTETSIDASLLQINSQQAQSWPAKHHAFIASQCLTFGETRSS